MPPKPPVKPLTISPEVFEIILRRPIPWDPAPDWLKLNADKLRQFAKLSLEFQKKELQIQMEKLDAVQQLIG